MRIIISFKENDVWYYDLAKIPEEISLEIANKLVEKGIAYIDEELENKKEVNTNDEKTN